MPAHNCIPLVVTGGDRIVVVAVVSVVWVDVVIGAFVGFCWMGASPGEVIRYIGVGEGLIEVGEGVFGFKTQLPWVMLTLSIAISPE